MNNNWIKIIRSEKKISQFKMAKALNITSQQLSAWELNKEEPDKKNIEKIKSFFQQPNIFFKKNQVSVMKKKFQRKDGANQTSKKINDGLLKDFYQSQNKPKIKLEKDKKAIMLFSGIGGMSLGFKLAGYNVIGHVENNKAANEIYELNFPNSQLLGLDIKKVRNEDLINFKKKNGEITVLAGGPPCQGFSLAGKRNVFDPRNELFKEFARFAKILKPKVIILENVKMLLTMSTKDGGLVKDYLIDEFSDAGYNLVFKGINMKNFGIPQSRERVVFIGLRKDLCKNKELKFPEMTNLENNNLTSTNYIETFRNATEDLEELESGQSSKQDPWHFSVTHPEHIIEMLKNVPEGKSAHENKDIKLRPTSGYNTTYKRIKWDEPSSTISTNFSMISGSRNVHPKNTRSLTIREAMRCQTFPDYFVLTGTLGEIRKGIGNAVPPKFAEFLANYIKTNLLNDKNIQL